MNTTLTCMDAVEVIKRDGSRVPFSAAKIRTAIQNAFKDVFGIPKNKEAPAVLQAKIDETAEKASERAKKAFQQDGRIGIEKIQDIVEEVLMEAGHHAVAKSYILYRDERAKARILKNSETAFAPTCSIHIVHQDGSLRPLDIRQIRRKLLHAADGLEGKCNSEEVLEEALQHLYNGASSQELNKAVILAARAKIEREPAYNYFTARLLLQEIYEEAFGKDPFEIAGKERLLEGISGTYREGFSAYIKLGITLERLSPELAKFDLEALSQNIAPFRDHLFQYLGLHILYDRYLIQEDNVRIETPQYFWMRIAMGLAINEKEKEKRAVEFYDALSQFYFVSSTPTLFNSGTRHSQLSSCFISTISDDLENIFKVISDNARLSKWAGGIGNDWSYVRAAGAKIKGTGGLTQGIIPFLKVANDTAVAVNQGGKRKGVACAYLETWHLDLEDFLELRKNTGDERRRTHDMNSANWIPDLFMQRVAENGFWTLFNPSETPDLHDLYGQAFNNRYREYEKLAAEGKLKQHKTVPAADLWRKMVTMLFETGHPWITFKDPCNIRSPQSHAGVVHSSNLCTEITLNTSVEETAVCNLGSVNLAAHMRREGAGYVLNKTLLSETVRTGMRMLDNVIDLNFYPTPETAKTNAKHRPVGLGFMGFQDALYLLRIPYDSQEAADFADESQEFIAYHAILSSAYLAKERGCYLSYPGSKWEKGLLPFDTIQHLEIERGESIAVDRTVRMNWEPVRSAIKEHGMRNSNTMAIAPTATISHISGVSPSIEPAYSNLFVRSNLSGEFTSLNPYLVEALKGAGLWNDAVLDDLKYYDGSVQEIAGIPQEIKDLYKTAFELDPKALINCASRRQKWIDMSQSLNLYVKNPTGRSLSDMYFHAWRSGLKTTYYLRSLAATQVEKSTIDVNKRGIQPRWMKSRSASSNIQIERDTPQTFIDQACRLADPGCESCQ